ncbi:hypothetical protein RFI_38091, partial [Reticulomyxa filosa]
MHQRSFFKYLYQQFPLFNRSPLNKTTFKLEYNIIKSMINMAKILCCRQYDHIQLSSKEKCEGIESSGEEEFLLYKKWGTLGEGCFFFFQDENLKRQKDLFSFDVFVMFSFFVKESNIEEKKELLSQLEKEKKLRVLLQVLGTPKQGTMNIYKKVEKEEKIEEEKLEEEEKVEEKKDALADAKTGNLHDQIVDKLCNNKKWSNYVLTLDNFLKMIAICMKIRTDTPIILMGETGCGKTSLIKFLAHAAN